MKNLTSLEEFVKAIKAFETGNSSSEVLIEQVSELINNGFLSEKNFEDLISLINASNLPSEIKTKLSDIVSSPKTRVFTHSPQSISPKIDTEDSDDNKSNSYSSSLLKEFLHLNGDEQRKDIKANQTIRGTYRLVSKIGEGGMGEVWKAIDLIQDAGDSQDKYVAIKFLSHELKNHPDALKALVREFARYKKLIHPNIVRAYEINRDEGVIFIVMEFLNGLPLKTFIQQHPNGLSLSEAKPIIQDMCKALHYAHQEGIIHLDFKPGNVFYDEEHHSAKVIDFGIARLASKEERDKTRFDPGILGAVSTAYASTEMLLMDEDPDPRDDVYGLACVSYELLTGSHPFNRTVALKAEREKLVPKPIKGLNDFENQAFLHALKFNRNERTANPEQFFQELYNYHPPTSKKRTYWLLSIPVLLLIIILSPFIFNHTYKSWNNNQIIKAINNKKDMALEKFLELSPDNQSLLLNDDNINLAFVEYVVSKYSNQLKAIDVLSSLNYDVQNILFKNPTVKTFLKNQFLDQIDNFLVKDDIDQALAFTRKIIEKYPESQQLTNKMETVINWRNNRLNVTENTFYQCLKDTSKSILYLYPCFQETNNLLKKLSPQRLELYNPELSLRFIKEISDSIYTDNFKLAEDLLSSWVKLMPEEIDKRQELNELLNNKKTINKLSNEIINQKNIQQQVEEFLLIDNNLKKELLSNPEIKNKLINYFKKVISLNLESNDYDKALQNYELAYQTFTDKNLRTNTLSILDNQIQQFKQHQLKILTQNYHDILKNDNPDINQLQDIVNKIKTIDQNNKLIQHPDIPENFSHKIINAIRYQQFTTADNLIKNWKEIRPDDINNKQLVGLIDKINEEKELDRNRKKILRKVQNAIKSGQLITIQNAINDLQNNYTLEENQQLLKVIQKDLIQVYLKQIDDAIKQDKYDFANKIADNGLLLYPQSSTLKNSKKTIEKEKIKRITSLISAFKESLYSDSSTGKDTFSYLYTINTLDNKFIDKNPYVIKTVETRLLTLAENENKLYKLQDFVSEWDKFLNNEHTSQTTIKDYQKSRNLIALRCLYTGQRLKNMHRNDLSYEFIMFGLTLNPNKTIRSALEKELYR